MRVEIGDIITSTELITWVEKLVITEENKLPNQKGEPPYFFWASYKVKFLNEPHEKVVAKPLGRFNSPEEMRNSDVFKLFWAEYEGLLTFFK